MIKNKPIISWWKSSDPCLYIDVLKNKLKSLNNQGPNINIIQTKNLTNDFCNLCLEYKTNIYLHINITGMGKTPFEPNIPSVKYIFSQLANLINSGFPQKQILVIVDPVIPNENGLKALRLLLRIFTEFKQLRLRFIRFRVLNVSVVDSKLTFKNHNIQKREITIRNLIRYIIPSNSFMQEYNKLLREYEAIISIDRGFGYLIGIRELSAFGYKNEWFDSTGNRSKLITYENNNRFKPILNLLSPKFAKRCKNMCVLCPWLG